MMINEEEALVLKTLEAAQTRSVSVKFGVDGESDPTQFGSFVKFAKSGDGSFYMTLSQPLADKPAYDVYYIEKQNAEKLKSCVAPGSKGNVEMNLLGGEQGKKSTKLLFERRKDDVVFMMSGKGAIGGIISMRVLLPLVTAFFSYLGKVQKEEDDFEVVGGEGGSSQAAPPAEAAPAAEDAPAAEEAPADDAEKGKEPEVAPTPERPKGKGKGKGKAVAAAVEKEGAGEEKETPIEKLLVQPDSVNAEPTSGSGEVAPAGGMVRRSATKRKPGEGEVDRDSEEDEAPVQKKEQKKPQKPTQKPQKPTQKPEKLSQVEVVTPHLDDDSVSIEDHLAALGYKKKGDHIGEPVFGSGGFKDGLFRGLVRGYKAATDTEPAMYYIVFKDNDRCECSEVVVLKYLREGKRTEESLAAGNGYARPLGRAPGGKVWDVTNGRWVKPVVGAEEDVDDEDVDDEEDEEDEEEEEEDEEEDDDEEEEAGPSSKKQRRGEASSSAADSSMRGQELADALVEKYWDLRNAKVTREEVFQGYLFKARVRIKDDKKRFDMTIYDAATGEFLAASAPAIRKVVADRFGAASGAAAAPVAAAPKAKRKAAEPSAPPQAKKAKAKKPTPEENRAFLESVGADDMPAAEWDKAFRVKHYERGPGVADACFALGIKHEERVPIFERYNHNELGIPKSHPTGIFELKFDAADCNDAFLGLKHVWLDDRDIKEGAPKHYFLLGGKYRVHSFDYKSHEGPRGLQKKSTFALANTQKRPRRDGKWVDIDESEVPAVMAAMMSEVPAVKKLVDAAIEMVSEIFKVQVEFGEAHGLLQGGRWSANTTWNGHTDSGELHLVKGDDGEWNDPIFATVVILLGTEGGAAKSQMQFFVEKKLVFTYEFPGCAAAFPAHGYHRSIASAGKESYCMKLALFLKLKEGEQMNLEKLQEAYAASEAVGSKRGDDGDDNNDDDDDDNEEDGEEDDSEEDDSEEEGEEKGDGPYDSDDNSDDEDDDDTPAARGDNGEDADDEDDEEDDSDEEGEEEADDMASQSSSSSAEPVNAEEMSKVIAQELEKDLTVHFDTVLVAIARAYPRRNLLGEKVVHESLLRMRARLQAADSLRKKVERAQTSREVGQRAASMQATIGISEQMRQTAMEEMPRVVEDVAMQLAEREEQQQQAQAGAPVLSEYEQRRRENIERNNTVLYQLRLLEDLPAPEAATAPAASRPASPLSLPSPPHDPDDEDFVPSPMQQQEDRRRRHELKEKWAGDGPTVQVDGVPVSFYEVTEEDQEHMLLEDHDEYCRLRLEYEENEELLLQPTFYETDPNDAEDDDNDDDDDDFEQWVEAAPSLATSSSAPASSPVSRNVKRRKSCGRMDYGQKPGTVRNPRGNAQTAKHKRDLGRKGLLVPAQDILQDIKTAYYDAVEGWRLGSGSKPIPMRDGEVCKWFVAGHADPYTFKPRLYTSGGYDLVGPSNWPGKDNYFPLKQIQQMEIFFSRTEADAGKYLTTPELKRLLRKRKVERQKEREEAKKVKMEKTKQRQEDMESSCDED